MAETNMCNAKEQKRKIQVVVKATVFGEMHGRSESLYMPQSVSGAAVAGRSPRVGLLKVRSGNLPNWLESSMKKN